MRLTNRVALVTAAAGAGIGRAVAERFAREGAMVVVSDAHAGRLKNTARELEERHGQPVLAIPCDVARRAEVDRMIARTLEHHGRIDILFNNAGINKLEPVWEMSDETWRRVLDVCLSGTFYAIRAALPSMMERRSGIIINVASMAGWLASDAGQAAYCAAKAGVMGLTRAVAGECGKYGIRVNAIAPGVIFNPFLERIYPPAFFEERKRQTLLGRLGEPEDVAHLAVFLASDESAYITGEVFCISGGAYVRP